MHIRHRFAAAVSAVALAFAAAAIASTANAQTPFQVEQGRELSLGAVDFGGSATVDPPQAGTLRFIESAPGDPTGLLYFTASASYIGPAIIRGIDGSGDPVTFATVSVVGPRSDVGATFTPRPAPGPCIVIDSGANVAFGDVTLGTQITAATQTVVRSCASINSTLAAAVAPATSGVAPNVVTFTPTDVTPAPAGSFRYEINAGFPVPLAEGASLFPGPFTPGTTRTFTHSLLVGAGSSGIGQQFSTTVTFTAMKATP